jgi:hypothetical protein
MAWIPLAISAGMGVASAATKKKDKSGFQTTPEYPEAQAARSSWWSKLQEWGQDPNYGGIAPDWADIWENAKGKVQRYFWGSATDPGAVNKVRSSLARRNASDSPAAEDLIARMGIEESTQLKDIATQEATQQAQFGENARQNWMQSLMGLAQQKPGAQYITTPANNTVSNVLGSLSSVGAGVSTYMQNEDQTNWLRKLLEEKLGQVPTR